jgi:hypothetical protein
MTMIYRRENGYGTIDTHSEPFQLGRRLYEAQRELSRVASGQSPDAAKLAEIAHWYCNLVSWMGQIRADYGSLLDVINGRAEYEYSEDGLRWVVKRYCLGKAREEQHGSE